MGSPLKVAPPRRHAAKVRATLVDNRWFYDCATCGSLVQRSSDDTWRHVKRYA